MILSLQGSSSAPDGTRSGIMQVLDMIEAPSAMDAMRTFEEDSRAREQGFTEFICVQFTGDLRPFSGP